MISCILMVILSHVVTQECVGATRLRYTWFVLHYSVARQLSDIY